MSSRKVNLFIEQGETYRYPITLRDTNGEDYDVSGFTATAEIRKSHISVNSVVFSTGLANGQLILSLTANQTTSMIPGRYIYNVHFTDYSNSVSIPISGIVTVTQGATQT